MPKPAAVAAVPYDKATPSADSLYASGNIMWNVLPPLESTCKLRGLFTGTHLGLYLLLLTCRTLLESFSEYAVVFELGQTANPLLASQDSRMQPTSRVPACTTRLRISLLMRMLMLTMHWSARRSEREVIGSMLVECLWDQGRNMFRGTVVGW